jgi:hypothetical protein
MIAFWGLNELMAGLPLRVQASELQPPLSLRDRKRRLNGFKLLESINILAQAGEVALTPGVALSL